MNATANKHGFALPIVLVLVTLGALLAGDAMRAGAVSQAQVVASRQRLRAFAAAETGLAHAETTLESKGSLPASSSLALDEGVTATIAGRLIEVDHLPVGFSANRVATQRFRIQSIGAAARGAQVELELGLARQVALP
jgi:hypothetical protein